MDRETKARIDSLLYELRSWDPGGPPRESLSVLAQRFGLDTLMVERLAQSEGWFKAYGVPEPVRADDTSPLDVDPER